MGCPADEASTVKQGMGSPHQATTTRQFAWATMRRHRHGGRAVMENDSHGDPHGSKEAWAKLLNRWWTVRHARKCLGLVLELVVNVNAVRSASRSQGACTRISPCQPPWAIQNTNAPGGGNSGPCTLMSLPSRMPRPITSSHAHTGLVLLVTESSYHQVTQQ